MSKLPRLRVANIADVFSIIFIALTVEHNANTLSRWESSQILAWFLSIGLDLAIAFSAYASCNQKLAWWPGRILSICWLVAMLAVSYVLNIYHYDSYKAGAWSPYLAGIFPASIALLGAIRGSLVKLDLKKIDDATMLENANFELANLIRHNAETSKKLTDLTAEIVTLQDARKADYASFENHRQEMITHYDNKLSEMQTAHAQQVLALQEKLKNANAKPPSNVSNIKPNGRSERARKAAQTRWAKEA